MRLRLGLFRQLQRGLLKRTRAPLPRALLRGFYAYTPPRSRPDIIVSAGGRTSFANAWLARLYGVPNIFIGSLRGLPAELFTAVLSLEPVPEAANNIVLQFPVSELDAEALQTMDLPENLSAVKCWALLVGGDGSGYRYRRNDWTKLGAALNQLAAGNPIRWLIATGPRTGQGAERLIRDAVEPGNLADASWYGMDRTNSLPLYLAAADTLFVTEDSMTMLGEALSAGKPVFSLRPETANPNQRYRNALQRYEARGLLSRLAISELQTAPGRVAEARFEAMSESPLKTLSRQLRKLGID